MTSIQLLRRPGDDVGCPVAAVEPSTTQSAEPRRDGTNWRTVNFVVPASVGCREADLVAEFLAWVPFPLDRRCDGSFFVALRLHTDDQWAYRFVIDGDRVINDWYADDYIVGPDGACLSLLHT